MNYSPYIPKTLIEYYENMKNWLIDKSSKLSNFQIGSRIRSLLEGLALELANSDLTTLNGFKNVSLDNLYTSFNFARKGGTKSNGFIRIEHTGHTSTLNYPIFTIDLFGISFTTVTPVSIPVGNTFVIAELLADTIGVEGNILANAIDTDQGKGTIIDPLGNIIFDRIYNPAAFTNGTNEESDANRYTRWLNFIKSARKTTPLAVLSAALKIQDVTEASVVNNINPYSNTPETGWVNVYITDGTGNPPSSLIDEVYKTLIGDPLDPVNYPGVVAAGVKVFVAGISNYYIDVVYNLKLKTSSPLTDSQAKAIVEAAAYNYVNNLPIGEDVLIETLQSFMLSADFGFYTLDIISPSATVNVNIAQYQKAKINTITPFVYPYERVVPI